MLSYIKVYFFYLAPVILLVHVQRYLSSINFLFCFYLLLLVYVFLVRLVMESIAVFFLCFVILFLIVDLFFSNFALKFLFLCIFLMNFLSCIHASMLLFHYHFLELYPGRWMVLLFCTCGSIRHYRDH